MQNINKKQKMLALLVVAVVGVGAFWGGMTYAQGKSSSLRMGMNGDAMQMRNGQFGGTGPGGVRGGRSLMNGGGFTTGEIMAKDDKTMTVKLQNGGSKIVFFGGSTKVSKSVDGALGDLSVGQNVMITGTTNPDGSVTAQSVQLRGALPQAPTQN